MNPIVLYLNSDTQQKVLNLLGELRINISYSYMREEVLPLAGVLTGQEFPREPHELPRQSAGN